MASRRVHAGRQFVGGEEIDQEQGVRRAKTKASSPSTAAANQGGSVPVRAMNLGPRLDESHGVVSSVTKTQRSRLLSRQAIECACARVSRDNFHGRAATTY